MTATHIEHDKQNQRFVLSIEDQQAVLEYRVNGNTLDFVSTYVPPQFRGKGHAERLVRHGLAWAKEQGYDIQASCWYADKFLRHG
ncbi:N-acetyltransferase [Saccharophagus sp. K07]|uniref:GNAT family N-acetyltransferase n=1 Tax=Saccharophagus sp. K07 TaxID=2283636 RepID=UPI0016528B24|nr:GNAT family N-acetyltransferase [Saccharophagus sp. K07]MBC6906883.1 N-acetyltransferase [Saccharophagus sp. K07]